MAICFRIARKCLNKKTILIFDLSSSFPQRINSFGFLKMLSLGDYLFHETNNEKRWDCECCNEILNYFGGNKLEINWSRAWVQFTQPFISGKRQMAGSTVGVIWAFRAGSGSWWDIGNDYTGKPSGLPIHGRKGARLFLSGVPILK